MKKYISVFLAGLLILSFASCNSKDDHVYAMLDTTKGVIKLDLFYKEAPLTVINFVGLAEGTLDSHKGEKFYDGLSFHRVISKANGDSQDFMIQGGDPLGNGTGGPGYEFENEIVSDLDFSKPGVLAMANAGADTNGSQFFITITNTEYLTGDYSIFGKVADKKSQNVVNSIIIGDKINKVKIVRVGKSAENFTATQADWNKARENLIENKEKAFRAAFPDFEKDENGIYWKILKQGDGSPVGEGKTVICHYKGYLVNGKVFDSSEGREPLKFETAAHKMIPGFDLMVQKMCLGEKRTIVIPPELAYKKRGIPGIIPGNAYIAFDIELVEVN